MSQGQESVAEELLSVSVADDKLSAHLYFTKQIQAFSCSAEQLELLLKSHGVVYGIMKEAIRRFADNPLAQIGQKFLVAVGDAAADGTDGSIRYTYDLETDERKPQLNEDGTVDYRELVRLKNVKKGELIAQRILATQGKPGRSVTGNPITAKDGKEARFKLGKNVVTDAESMKLFSAIDGLVTLTDRDKINVFPVYEINGDVDYNVGNIDFVGNVVIRGNVLTGFRVKAAGDIRVSGGVEGAELEAGGAIEITAGILGGNKGKVKAGTNVKSSFVMEGNVEAGEDIIVSQSAMHSHLKAGKNVICKGSKGLIVGGIIQAGEKIVARTIGNSMSTATVLEVGVLPEMRNELIALRTQLKGNQDSLGKTEQALGMLDQLASTGQLSGDKMALRIKLNHTKKQALEEQNQLKERILEIEKSLEEIEKARVDVIGTIYAGTKIVIGRYTRFVKDPTTRVSFRLFDGEITLVSNFSL